MKILTKWLVVLIAFTASINTYGQIPRPIIDDGDGPSPIEGSVSVSLTGTTTVNQNSTYSYSVNVSGGLHSASSYSVSGGTITSQSRTSVSVRWTSAGSGSVRVNATVNGSIYFASKNVNVVAPLNGGSVTASTSTNICSGGDPGIINNNQSPSGGSGSYSYQWQILSEGPTLDGGSLSLNWVNVSGARYSTYNPPALNVNTSYRRKVTSGSRTAYSNIISYNVSAPVNKGSISYSGGSINPNTKPAKISGTTATGGNGISYRWQWKRGTESSFTNIPTNLGSSVTSRDYQPQNLSKKTVFRRRVTSCGTNYYTNQVTINVNLKGGSVSGNQTICAGADASNMANTASATGGNGSYSYKWERREYRPTNLIPTEEGPLPGGSATYSWSGWTEFASGSSYNPGVLTYKTQYRRKVTSNGSTAYSNTITKSIYAAAGAGTISYSGGNVNAGSAPSQGITGTTATGGSSVSYKWQKKTTGSYSDIGGATGKNYTPGTLTRTTSFIRIARTNCGSTATSNAVTINVNLNPGSIASGNQTICRGSNPGPIGSNSAASGAVGNYKYQWQVFNALQPNELPSNGSSNWTDITGEKGLTYDPPVLNISHSYRRKVTSGSKVAYSATKTFTVTDAVNKGSISYTGGSINPNTKPAKISGTTATGGDGIAYRWQWKRGTESSFTNIPSNLASSVTSRDYQPQNLDKKTVFRRRVTSCGTNYYSNQVTINVNLKGGSVSGNQTICEGTDASNMANTGSATGGNGSYSYKWERREYRPTNLIPTEEGGLQGGTAQYSWTQWTEFASGSSYNPGTLTYKTQYRRKVTSNGLTAYSNTITKSIYSAVGPGSISYSGGAINPNTAPSQGITGTTATGGSSVSYQWQKKTTGSYKDISGATNKDYTPGTLSQTTSFIRIATTSCGSAASSNAVTITVNLNPGSIASGNQTICRGSNPGAIASNAAASGGSGGYVYQWQVLNQLIPNELPSGGNDDGWVDISGEKGLTFDPPALTVNKSYRRKVTSGNQTAYSAVKSYTMTATVNKGSISYTGGSINPNTKPAKISGTTATGGDGIAYRWQWKRGTESSFTNIPTNLGSSVTLRDYQPQNLDKKTVFRRRVTSCGTNYYTNQITINVNLKGGSVSGNQTICEGADASNMANTASATGGNGSYSYKWEQREYRLTNLIPTEEGGLQGGTAQYSWTQWVEFASGSSYNPGVLNYKTQYRRKVTSDGASAYSNTITKTIYATVDPGSISYAGGAVNSGSAPTQGITGTTATGGSSVSYQWQKKTTGTYADIDGATNRDYTPGTLTRNTSFIRIATTNCGSTATSNPITITVNLNPGSIASGSETICRGSNPGVIANNAAATGGTGSYDYQWQMYTELVLNEITPEGPTNATIEDNWMDIAGEKGLTFDPPVLNVDRIYRRRVKSGNQTAYTASKQYTVSAPLTPGSISYSGGAVNPDGDPVNIKGTAAGGGISPDYQWQSKVGTAANFSNIGGATNKDYNPPSGIDYTTSYKRRVKSCGATEYTNVITIDVNFSAGSIGGNQTVCQGEDPAEITSTAPAKGGKGGYNYQWQKSEYRQSELILQNPDNELPGGGLPRWTTWVDITGEKGLTFNPSGQTYATKYRRVVVSGGVTKITNEVTVDFDELPEAGTITYTGGTINAGSIAAQIKGTSVTSSDNFRYKWQKRVTGSFQDIGSSNLKDLNPGVINVSTTFKRLVLNDCGGVSESNTVKIPVRLVEGTPASSTIQVCHDCEKPSVTVSNPIGGNGTYAYQWQMLMPVLLPTENEGPAGELEGPDLTPNEFGDFQDITNAKSAEYPIDLIWVGTRTFRRKVVSDGQTVYSDPIEYTIYPALNPGTISYNSPDPCEGNQVNNISGTEASGGNNNYEYQWQYYNGSGWSTFTGSNSTSYNPDFNLNTDTKFRRRVRSAGSTWKKSNELTIDVYDIITNIGSLSATTDKVCDGETVSLSYSPANGVDTNSTRLYGSKDGVEKDFGKISGVKSIRVNKGYSYYVKYLQRCTPIDYASNSKTFNFFESCNIPPSLDQNFVRTEVPKVPVREEHELGALGPDDRSVTYAYTDGLGRSTMTVAAQAGQGYEDLIQFNEFADNGRMPKEFMPYYTKSENPGEFISLQTNKNKQEDFYEESAHGGDSYAYSLKEYDERGRVRSIIAPGENFQSKSTEYYNEVFDPSLYDETDETTFMHDLVGHWAIEGGEPVNDGYYQASELTVSMVKDMEGNLSRKVVDTRGLIITSQIYDHSIQRWVGSYSVYDEMGRVRFIVPPAITRNLNDREPLRITSTEIQELVFEYEYDSRGRLSKERAPGAGWNHYIYDQWDRVVLKRHDGQFTSAGSTGAGTVTAWTFYKYDALNRLILTGQFGTSLTTSELKDKAKTATKRFETTSDGSVGYTVTRTFPEFGSKGLGDNYHLETINYFDNYDFINSNWDSQFDLKVPDGFTGFGWAPAGYILVTEDIVVGGGKLELIEGGATGPFVVNGKYAVRPGGSVTLHEDAVAGPDFEVIVANAPYENVSDLTTGSKVRILGTNDWLRSTVYYDERGRVVQSITENHKGGIERLSSQLDWKGELQKMLLEHSSFLDGQFNEGVSVLNEYEYLHTGQISRVYQTINKINEQWIETRSGERILLSEHHYNVLGELIEKNLHSSDESSFLQSVDYSYNIQRALTQINDPNKLGGPEKDLFGMKYYYEDGIEIDGTKTDGRFDGKVSAIEWNATNSTPTVVPDGGPKGNQKLAITFDYDNRSRLNTTSYASASVGAGLSSEADLFDLNVSEYDENGNIVRLSRHDQGDKIDDLTYEYYPNSNRLRRVTDAEDPDKGFKDKQSSPEDWEYQYDGMGNMIADLNKGIAAIKYNYMQLVTEIQFDDESKISYTYDAVGNRLSKAVIDADENEIARVDYIGIIEYLDDNINQIFTDEGRAYRQNDEYHYEYFITDLQGNNRMSFGNLPDRNIYTATMERKNKDYEQSEFTFPNQAIRTDLENHTPLGDSSIYLNGTVANRRLGLAKVLTIQPGDEVEIEAWAKYTSANGQGTPLGDIVGSVLTAFGAIPNDGGSGEALSDAISSGGPGAYVPVSDASDPNDAPDAYIAYLFFDENNQFVPGYSSFLPVTDDSFNKFYKLQMAGKLTINQRGSLLIYMANETDENQEVYFDDLKIVHSSANQSFKVSQINDYYPFGMTTSTSWKAKGYIDPGLLYQSSFSSLDSLTGYYDFQSRSYDPALGRFFAVDPANQFSSPYIGMGNLPHWGTDPNGETFVDALINIGSSVLGYLLQEAGRSLVKSLNGEGSFSDNFLSNGIQAGVNYNTGSGFRLNESNGYGTLSGSGYNGGQIFEGFSYDDSDIADFGYTSFGSWKDYETWVTFQYNFEFGMLEPVVNSYPSTYQEEWGNPNGLLQAAAAQITLEGQLAGEEAYVRDLGRGYKINRVTQEWESKLNPKPKDLANYVDITKYHSGWLKDPNTEVPVHLWSQPTRGFSSVIAYSDKRNIQDLVTSRGFERGHGIKLFNNQGDKAVAITWVVFDNKVDRDAFYNHYYNKGYNYIYNRLKQKYYGDD